MIALTVAGDGEAAARTAAERIAAAVAEARAERGVAHVSLAGGRTPRRAYQELARLVPDWSGVHLWLGDERCVPPGDPDSNARLVEESLLAGARSPGPVFHPVRGAAEDPARAAAAYERELRATVQDRGMPVLDLALLGLGEDGHTASLFPDDPVLEERERLCVPVHGTKSPFQRVTLTLPLLTAARRVVVLAEGAGKAWAIHALLSGPSPRVPASLLADADVELICDLSAAPA